MNEWGERFEMYVIAQVLNAKPFCYCKQSSCFALRLPRLHVRGILEFIGITFIWVVGMIYFPNIVKSVYCFVCFLFFGRGGGAGGVGGRGLGVGGEACDFCQCSHMSNTPMHDVHMLKVLVWTQ